MEYRILVEQEIEEAVRVARYVYDISIEPGYHQPRMRQLFLDYVETDHLKELVRNGRLTMWGAFWGTQMYGVSAMQPEGHITMLYVLPQYQRRGFGKHLLQIMKKYAYSEYNLSKVTISVTPAWMYGYFAESGFREIRLKQTVSPLFIPMRARSDRTRVYMARLLSEKKILAVVVGFLSFIVMITVIFVLWYWLR